MKKKTHVIIIDVMLFVLFVLYGHRSLEISENQNRISINYHVATIIRLE